MFNRLFFGKIVSVEGPYWVKARGGGNPYWQVKIVRERGIPEKRFYHLGGIETAYVHAREVATAYADGKRSKIKTNSK